MLSSSTVDVNSFLKGGESFAEGDIQFGVKLWDDSVVLRTESKMDSFRFQRWHI